MNLLEMLVVVLAACVPVLALIRRATHEIMTCMTDLRVITVLAKKEATKAQNTAQTATTQITDDLTTLTRKITALDDDIRDLTRLVHRRISRDDDIFETLNERLESLETHS